MGIAEIAPTVRFSMHGGSRASVVAIQGERARVIGFVVVLVMTLLVACVTPPRARIAAEKQQTSQEILQVFLERITSLPPYSPSLKEKDRFVTAVWPGKILEDGALAFCDGRYAKGDQEAINCAYLFAAIVNDIFIFPGPSGKRLDTIYDLDDTQKVESISYYDKFGPAIVTPLPSAARDIWTDSDLEPTIVPYKDAAGRMSIRYYPPYEITASFKYLEVIRPWFKMDKFIAQYTPDAPEAVITGLIVVRELRIVRYTPNQVSSSGDGKNTNGVVTIKQVERLRGNAIVGYICVRL